MTATQRCTAGRAIHDISKHMSKVSIICIEIRVISSSIVAHGLPLSLVST